MPESFRFVHTGDLHLDSPFVGVTAEAPPAVARVLREATVRAWANVVQLAVDEHADFMVVAGDVFEHANRTLLGQVRFRDGLQRLADAGIPSYVVTGNHDPLSGWEPSVRWPELAYRFPADRVEARPVVRGGREIARIHGISYATRDVRDNLARRFRRDADAPFSIGLLHANVGGQPGHGLYAPCSIADLQAAGMDYWALGHVHRHGVLVNDPPAIYCGNPQGRDPGETEPRGCYLVEVDARGRVAATFRETDVVRWQQLEVPIAAAEGEEALADAVAAAVDGARREAGRPIVARVTLTGRGPLHDALRRGETLAGEIGVLAAERIPEAGDGFAWIESVRDATRPELDVRAGGLAGTFVGELLNEVDAVRTMLAERSAASSVDEVEASGWEASLDELYGHTRLRRLVRGDQRRLDRPDRDRIAALLDDAEAMLVDGLVPSD